ncbi:hypothetical protein BGZ94_007359 [Podila epigama]|nr:hypothetical protein BGZ94_007359 [Podila epigama]
MQLRLQFTLGLIVALTVAILFPSEQKSRLDAIAPLILGLIIGLIVAETPIASPIQGLLGLSSRHPDIVGLDILHAASSISAANDAKAELNQKTMYGLQHAFLNLEVTGWWFNMGFWDKTRNMRFQEACQALVDKVTRDLKITSDSHILGKYYTDNPLFVHPLDMTWHVGFGCGDQDVYMARRYQPAKITGITIEPIQHHVAQELVKQSNLTNTTIDLHIADASHLNEFLKMTPGIFEATAASETFSHVVSIDSAYHYNTRAQFLKNAFNVLTPGTGYLALADMILAKPAPTSTLGRYIFEAVFGAMEVPLVNMKTMSDYQQDLADTGFVDVEIECIEENVFSGLAAHIDAQTSRFGGFIKPGVQWTYWGLSKGLWWLARSKWLHFVVVRARKPIS